MFFRLDRFQRMGDAGGGIAGRLDDHLDALVATGVAAAFGEAGACDAGGVPADDAACRLARSGSRSAITATSRPAIDGTCAKNIEPNFPAPMSPTRTG